MKRAVLLALAGVALVVATAPALAAKSDKDKDKTPPVILGLRTESVTHDSALALWTTDELAESDIKYGIDPKNNTNNGPSDKTLILNHAIALSGLQAETTYAFCVMSRDEAHNKAEACGTFTTLGIVPPPPPPPSATGGTGGGARPTLAYISGFAYPGAKISVSLRSLPTGTVFTQETTAANDASFKASFGSFLQGLYLFSITAKDTGGASSVRKGFQFDFREGDAPLYKEKIVIPPTLTVARDIIAWGDDLRIFGHTVPGTGVLIAVGDILYETKSDGSGFYEILINSARFTPGKISLRARSSLVSDFGLDYSPSKTVILTLSSTPKADLNADGRVDIADFSKFLAQPVDMNGDAVVNSTDVGLFLRAFSTKGH